MARAYSEDLRGRALDMVDQGRPVKEVSQILQLGVTTVRNWVSCWQKEGRREAKTGLRAIATFQKKLTLVR
jgi:transposase